jgi:chemotaxis protein methyltransferase CheR
LSTNNLIEIYNHIISSHQGYLDFLNTLTIHVTDFFRDKQLWEYLREDLFISILNASSNTRSTPNKPYRIWSAGCSSGQEPYSLAISFVEAYKKRMYKKGRPMTWNIRRINALPFEIFASDINDRIIKTAQDGIYSKETLKKVDPRIIRDYFVKKEDGYHISEYIKKKVTFKQLDLFKDRFPKKLDLIACRNVIIYFTKEQQSILFKKFWESLTPHSHLIIGKSELLPRDINKYFKSINLREHVYETIKNA